jgi:hypothetical protein
MPAGCARTITRQNRVICMKTALQCLVMLLLLTAMGGTGLAAAQDEIDATAERSIAFEYGKTIYNDPDHPELDESVVCSIGDPARWIDESVMLLDDRKAMADMPREPGTGISADDWAWWLVQKKLKEHMQDELNPIVIEENNLLGWGIDNNGYFFVSIITGKEISQECMIEIYQLVQRHAIELGLYDKFGLGPEEMPVPLVFRHNSIPSVKPDTVYRNGTDTNIETKGLISSWIPSVNRASKYRPIVSGCQVMVKENSVSYHRGTVCCAATDSSGKKGYIVSKHLVYNLNDKTVYQPDPDVSESAAGKVTKMSGSYADAAFVPYSNVKAAVLTDYQDTERIRGINDPWPGQYVFMCGVSSGVSSGEIIDCWSKVNHPDLGYLYDQWRATYSSKNGDSGAGVFRKGWRHRIELVGIHWGKDQFGYALLSPTSAITSELGVTILTS